jgi:hypothetical protein
MGQSALRRGDAGAASARGSGDRGVLPDPDRVAPQPAGRRAIPGEAERRGLALPGLFGVFYYRSANTRTLETLREFLPVPVDALREEFAAGATPDSVCARSIRELTASGARHFYVSNLPIGRAASTLERILKLV